MNGYQEILPSEELRKYVECLWFRRTASPAESTHHVLPDGCIDIVLNFGDTWEREKLGKRARIKDRAFVVGAMTRSTLVHASGRMDFFGVRFRPGCAQAFLHLPAAELTDRTVLLEDVFGSEAPPLVDHLSDQTPHQRAATLDHFLRRLMKRAVMPDQRVQFAVDSIIQSGGTLSIEELCTAASISRQHLARLFQQTVGISPKMLCRIFRFRSVLAGLREEARVDWANAAAELGYYDQPHLILDFKEFSGVTPAEYLLR